MIGRVLGNMMKSPNKPIYQDNHRGSLSNRLSCLVSKRLGCFHTYENPNFKPRAKMVDSTEIKIKKNIPFEEFKREHIESLEEYSLSPAVKEVFRNDKEKIIKAYNDYCSSKYDEYQQSLIGGNPSRMV